MKTNRLSLLLLSLIMSAVFVYASPQKTDPEFTAFLTKFRAALAKNDKAGSCFDDEATVSL